MFDAYESKKALAECVELLIVMSHNTSCFGDESTGSGLIITYILVSGHGYSFIKCFCVVFANFTGYFIAQRFV